MRKSEKGCEENKLEAKKAQSATTLSGGYRGRGHCGQVTPRARDCTRGKLIEKAQVVGRRISTCGTCVEGRAENSNTELWVKVLERNEWERRVASI